MGNLALICLFVWVSIVVGTLVALSAPAWAIVGFGVCTAHLYAAELREVVRRG